MLAKLLAEHGETEVRGDSFSLGARDSSRASSV
jgi:hypothetical protein